MKLPRIVVALGFVSLFTDMASEMVYPLLPKLVAVLGAGAWWLGAIEGVGDATAAVLKLYAGKMADKIHRRKPLALAGYALSNLVRPLVVLAVAPWQLVAVRFMDRIGKGIRSSPRDALLAASSSQEKSASIFGFHRGMDNLGATLGPLLVWGGLLLLNGDVHKVLLASILPGLLAVLTLGAFVREEVPPPSARPASSAVPEPPPGALRSYLLILGIFSIANTSDLFLLRRMEELGTPTTRVALFWAALNGVRALAGYPGGVLADRIGRARSMMLGWLLYAGAYGVMGTASTMSGFLPGFFAYGLFYGFTEGAERAIVASLAPRSVLGAAFGRFHLVTGLAMLPSNLLFGFAWDRWGGPPCLLVSGAGALVALAALSVWARRHPAG